MVFRLTSLLVSERFQECQILFSKITYVLNTLTDSKEEILFAKYTTCVYNFLY